MAVDGKYGRVTLEHGDIGEDEPVVVFRARDTLLPKLLAYYHLFCMKAGSPKRHLDLIFNDRERVRAWQQENRPKLPDSEASRAWMAPPEPKDRIGKPTAPLTGAPRADAPQTKGSVPPSLPLYVGAEPQPDGSALPLYVHVGLDPVTTDRTKVNGIAWPSGSSLYTFSDDSPGQPPTGISSDWQHYTGSVDYWQQGQTGDVADGARPHACSPTGYCPPADEAKPATDTKANLMVLALATDDTTKKEELQSVLDQLAWVELTSRAHAHRQLDAVLDMFAKTFGEPYMGGGGTPA